VTLFILDSIMFQLHRECYRKTLITITAPERVKENFSVKTEFVSFVLLLALSIITVNHLYRNGTGPAHWGRIND